MPSLAVEILYSELQAAPSMLIEVPSVGTNTSLDGELPELCDAAAEVTRGALVSVMDRVGSAVIPRTGATNCMDWLYHQALLANTTERPACAVDTSATSRVVEIARWR
ncbi:hypothetical protein GCM10027057_18870 [Marisediminicola antarctica]